MRRAIGALLLLVLLSGFSEGATPPVEEIVRRHIEAIGGARQWQKVQTIMVKGTTAFGSFTWVWKQPNMVRTEDREIGGAGRTIITAFDGKTGWTVNGYKESPQPQRMKPEAQSLWATGLVLRSDLLDLPAKGSELKFLGYDTVDGRVAYKLSLKREGRDEVRLWIDRESFLIVQRAREVMAPWGEEKDVVTPIRDYRKVDGVLIPHKIVTTPLTIEVNAELDDALFRPPRGLE